MCLLMKIYSTSAEKMSSVILFASSLETASAPLKVKCWYIVAVFSKYWGFLVREVSKFMSTKGILSCWQLVFLVSIIKD